MSSMYCPHCGKLIEEGDIYCRHCGTKISYPGEEEPPKSLEDDPIDQTFSHMKEMQRQSYLHKERMQEERNRQREEKIRQKEEKERQERLHQERMMPFAVLMMVVLVAYMAVTLYFTKH